MPAAAQCCNHTAVAATTTTTDTSPHTHTPATPATPATPLRPLRALLRQSVAECATYWVFVPSHDRSAAQAAIPELDATARRFGRVVYIHFVPDRLVSSSVFYQFSSV